MRILTVAALALAFAGTMAITAPAPVQAKAYQGDYRGKVKHRAMTNRRQGGESASAGCLTSEARNLLGRIKARFGNVQIISTCRPGARIATTGRPSKHGSGQAIDFRVPGRKGEVVKWLIANHHSGGTMTYRDMDHVHVDVGARFVALNRNSGRT